MDSRQDGRRPDELRQVRIETGYLRDCEGSALIELGQTKLICSATLEQSVPAFLKGMEGGWLTAEYGMLPRSVKDRVSRERHRSHGRHLEIQRIIGRSLRAVCDLDLLPQVTLLLDCDVIQADGGTRVGAVTGAFVALQQAVDNLMRRGVLNISPILDFCCGVSVGIVRKEKLLDLTQEEDARADVDLNISFNGRLEILDIQGTAEGRPFSNQELDELVELAQKGASKLIETQREALGIPLKE